MHFKIIAKAIGLMAASFSLIATPVLAETVILGDGGVSNRPDSKTPQGMGQVGLTVDSSLYNLDARAGISFYGVSAPNAATGEAAQSHFNFVGNLGGFVRTNDDGVGLGIGDPLMLHSNGIHYTAGLPTVGFSYRKYGASLFVGPKLPMIIYDSKSGETTGAMGGEIAIERHLDDTSIFRLAGVVAATGITGRSGSYYMGKVEFEKRVKDDSSLGIRLGAEASHLALDKTDAAPEVKSTAVVGTVGLGVLID